MSGNKMEVRMAFTCCKISGSPKSVETTNSVYIQKNPGQKTYSLAQEARAAKAALV
ncbi:MAG TPA: hypothetical protein VIF82_08615 [Burkholderiaceae bacterium]|jgi:hypothetical protein